ncbi:MAG: regulator of chromosome condensation 1/beta-lactamase-inhibitor protein II [Olpidium bornovanus]|uniref:Regulator of chromosome condensation 1/beta-lactamase-inhibitor protein II n=1 Tax=Olpidium bornovanus TaxID=278681 RepID=A0A8H7ZPW5_9FUNG|nr:MAG: regulator of chromosome condensation 1/beta-lactamase-inhibitor protein II [Olpidium bornovanus]
MQLSDFAARRSNCMKRAVGCILVKDRRIISTGYNGTPRGLRNCGEGGCRRCNMNSRCGHSLDTCLCLHAEENALIEAGRTRLDDGQSTLKGCAKKIVQVGVSEVVYSQAYGMDDLTRELFEAAGVRFRNYRPLDFVMDNLIAGGDSSFQSPLSRSPSSNGKLEVSGGKLQAFGSNGHGQLGVGRAGDLSLPVTCVFAAPESISLRRPPRLVTGGGNHTLLVTERGDVYGCGLNDTGQLGLAVKKKRPAGPACGATPNDVRAMNGAGQTPDDSVNNHFSFQLLPLPPCVAAACGWSHSLVVDNAGNVYSFGSAKHGQLGVNQDRLAERPDWIDRPVRVMFPGDVRISGVAAGRRHSVAVDAQGGVWAWGSARGALGLATPPPDGNNAERDDEEQCVATKSTDVPRKVDVPAKIVRAACGANHTALLSEDGRVFTCGENRHGQLGYATRAERTARLREAALPAGSAGVDVVCGWSHTAVLLGDGRICAWGRGDKGQLGPVREGVSPFEPRIIEFRFGEGGRPPRVSAVAAGAEHTLCAFEDGRWAAWGWNEHGNCGTGDQADVFEPAVTDAPAAVKAVGSGYGHSFVWSVGR